MEIVLISVMHTGTHVLKRIFDDAGFTGVGIGHSPPDWCVDAYRHGHVLTMNCSMLAIRLGETMPVVCPLRHPYRVEESWKRRGKEIGPMIAQFRELAGKFAPMAHVVPVDGPERDHWLDQLSGVLGRDLKTDWPIVRSISGTHDLALGDCNPSAPVEALVGEIGEFLAEFY